MEYDRNMDRQCISLCNALNAIPGVSTYESCCGHNKHEFRIWFTTTNVNGLYVIARVLDPRYYYFPTWSCRLDGSDMPEYSPTFFLHSGSHKGRRAYREAEKLAKCIYHFLSNEKLMDHYQIKG
jgi:hypothetical protein